MDIKSKTIKGIVIYQLNTWEELKYLFDCKFSSFLNLAFRGQRCEHWELLPTLTRKLKDEKKFKKDHPYTVLTTIDRHLKLFEKCILGRRGDNPKKLSENDLWALGQHHGLETPLLDWTTSPYVATFFAFKSDEESPNGRAIWAVDLFTLEHTAQRLEQYLEDHPELDKNKYGLKREVIEIIRPNNDENDRLISQGGLFTKIPFNTSLEQWAEKYMCGHLIKIVLPENERNRILRSLDIMNINDSTLFPDLAGASSYCNYMLEIHGNGSLNSAKQVFNQPIISFNMEDLAD